ncbi:protein FRIGIDA-like [Miscanthus floridulus]|uniref:protein FRIGIDA-like n=1 Tax=Miscanthus floridulus TaxID=154761 RepID=UPI003457B0D6
MPPPPPPPPPASTASRAAMLHSVNTLASFSDTLADFLDQWNSVVLDVASIAATFAVLFPGPRSNPKPYLPAPEPQPQTGPAPEPDREPEPTLAPQPDREPEPTLAPQPEPAPNAAPAPETQWEREPSPFPEPAPATQPSPAPEPAPAPQPESAPAPLPNPDRERKDGGGDAYAAELEHRCQQMNCRGVRRFVTAQVRDGGGEWLRQVGPGALRRAPDPAALVLRAVGRYYIRAESPDVEAACTLLLELYVRAGCPRLRGQGREVAELLLRQEAREAALTWRSRLLRVSGGGVGDAPGAAGARGLTLFMAAFGVPVEFPAQELCDLVDAADVSACVEVLKASKLFVRKMRDVVIEMINKAMYLQAMRIILAFEFQEAFPLAPTLALIIEKLEHDTKDESEGQASERDEEDLALLSSISKCIEDHKLSPSEFTSFAAKIALLEERVGKPKQACTGVKRKRSEECVE